MSERRAISVWAVAFILIAPFFAFAASYRATKQTEQAVSASMPMNAVLPLFATGLNFTSTLVIVNVTNVPTYTDVTLTGLDGKQITEKRVQLPPRTKRSVDIAALLASASSVAMTGRIMVAQSPTFKGMIGAQLLLTYTGSAPPSYIDEDEAMPSQTGSQLLRGVADDPTGSPIIAVTNLSDMPQAVTVQCSAEAARTFTKLLALPAQGTVISEACTSCAIPNGDLDDGFINPVDKHEARAVGISLTTTGMPGSFAAFGLALHADANRHYFSNIVFSDPKTILSSTTVFTGVPVGFSSPLPSATYTPQLSLANFSGKATQVEVKYAWTSGGTPRTLNVGAVTIPPYAAKTVALTNLLGDSDMQNSFLVSSDAVPGDVIAKLVSKSESALAETELLAKDEDDPMNSGEHPWSLDHGLESMLLLFNHSSTSQAFQVVIDGGGVTWEKIYRLQPMQTTSIQLQVLINDQVKDEKGRIIPRDTVEGVVYWFTSGPAIGKGRLLISSQTAAMARSFSCFQYTIVTGAKAATQITNDVPLNAQNVHLAVANQNVASASTLTPPHCGGAPISGNIGNLTYSWRSGDTSIATIYSGTGEDVYVNGVGAGATAIIATLTDQYGCQQTSTAQATVVSVSISLQSSGTVSSSNSASSEYESTTGSLGLGIKTSTQSGFKACFGGVQLTGAVSPSDYPRSLQLHRTIESCGTYINSSNSQTCPTGDDTSSSVFRDDDPSTSGGHIYDLDPPGVENGIQSKSVYRFRANFSEYATLSDGKTTVSTSPLNYYVRLSCKFDANGNASLDTSVSGDNQIGSGTTNTSWNLQ